MRPLRPHALGRFLKAAAFDRWRALWMLLATSGLRPSEALGLGWSDWDRVTGRVRVRYELGDRLRELRGRRVREIVLPEIANAEMRRHSLCDIYRRRGTLLARPRFVFWVAGGDPLDPQALTASHFRPLLDEAGVRPSAQFGLDDLTHTAATLYLANGEAPEIVRQILGHETVEETLRGYGAFMPDAFETAAERMHWRVREALDSELGRSCT